MDSLIALAAGGAAATAWSALKALRWSLVFAEPDEWLLRIRDGKLLDAGVGIWVWRRPGDVLARFSSTLQRVKFTADALSADRLAVRLEGFILWSVAQGGDNPLKAFSKLGIANLDQRLAGLKSPKHLLTPAQHKAFQALLGAELQQVASTLKLAELLSGPVRLVPALSARLQVIAERLGIAMEQVEIVSVLPVDATLLSDLRAEEEQRVRSEGARVRLEAATKLSEEEAKAKAEQDAFQARAALAMEEERARLLEAQAQVFRRKAESEREQRLSELETKRVLALAAEETEALVQQARLARARREAEVQAEITRLGTAAEAEKPEEVRAYELSKLKTERMAGALAQLPLKEAKWVSLGGTPVESLGAMLEGFGEALAKRH